jgi:transcriptional regulator with XRE-family HTH domain
MRVDAVSGYNAATATARTPCSGLRKQFMATTLATIEAREVLRCDHCSLVQFRTSNSLCRRCHKPLEMEEPEPLVPQLVTESSSSPSEDSSLEVARAVRDIRRSRKLSQRQLAGRMQVPRTYISKIENGKAMPTLSSLERLARALEIDICDLLRDARSRQHEEVAAIMADPFLKELAPFVSQLDAYQRSIFLNQVRDMALGRRRLA